MKTNRFTNRAFIFFVIACIGLCIQFFTLSVIIGDDSTIKLRCVLYFADSLVLMAFYWLCPPKLRWMPIPLIWIISVFLFSNALYFRYWGDMFPLSSIFISSNYNSFIFNSIPSLLHISDLTFFITPAFVSLLFFIIRPGKAATFPSKIRILAISASLILYIAAFALSVNGSRKYAMANALEQVTAKEIIAKRFGLNSTQTGMWRLNGFIGYIIAQINNYPTSGHIFVTDTQRQNLADFIASVSSLSNDSTVITGNRNKNLVFIIVESLNAWTIDRQYGSHELTPVLSALAHSDSSVASTDMYAQINDGGSSDGQLIYNTGLLPLLTGVAAQSHAENTYPSIVKALRPESSAEFIVESASVYNHRRTSSAFGYDSIFDETDLLGYGWDKHLTGADDAVLNFAFDHMLSMSQPFFAEITTLSMHYPFNIDGFEPVEWIDSIGSIDSYMKRYLQTVHYTDAAIGRFLDKLAASPLSSNTVVVIASDHDCAARHQATNDNPDFDQPIVFIAFGPGIKALPHNVTMSQVDVFPTILDIMGVTHAEYPWRGLGSSILSGDVNAAVSRNGQLYGKTTPEGELRLRRAFEVSDSLIKSDYFSY